MVIYWTSIELIKSSVDPTTNDTILSFKRDFSRSYNSSISNYNFNVYNHSKIPNHSNTPNQGNDKSDICSENNCQGHTNSKGNWKISLDSVILNKNQSTQLKSWTLL